MGETGDSRAMLERFQRCFGDGVLDLEEFEEIIAIAMRDGKLDPAERQVLKEIIFSLTSADLKPDLWERVEEVVRMLKLDEAS